MREVRAILAEQAASLRKTRNCLLERENKVIYQPHWLNTLNTYKLDYSWPNMIAKMPASNSKSSMASWFMNLQEKKLYCGATHRANFDGI